MGESQLDDEQRRLVDAQKSQRRTDRRIKELTFSQDEDHKNHERMQELIDKLQNKVKSYKKQIEEAEEIAALNLAKFRKVQADLESSEERADINEQVLCVLYCNVCYNILCTAYYNVLYTAYYN